MNRGPVRLGVIALAVLTHSLSPAAVDSVEKARTVSLNVAAFEHARRLLITGCIVNDGKGRWRVDKPSTQRENEFLRQHGFAEYAKWHLGIDDRHPETSKARYKFPFGDFENVHRCGLLAVKNRAREYGYSDIGAAADELLRDQQFNRPKR